MSPTGEAGKRSAQRANGEQNRRLPRLRLGGLGFARAGTTRIGGNPHLGEKPEANGLQGLHGAQNLRGIEEIRDLDLRGLGAVGPVGCVPLDVRAVISATEDPEVVAALQASLSALEAMKGE